MENNIPQNILEKLKKLLDFKADREGKGGDAEKEAENAALRIQELLMRYNLDPSVLENVSSKDENKGPDILQHIFDLAPLIAPNESSWVEDFINWVAKVNYCESVTYIGNFKTKKRGVKIALIGKELNIQIVWYTCEQLINRIRANGKAQFKRYTGPEKKNTYMRGYLKGAAMAIYHKLQAIHESNLASNNQFALMVTSNALALRDALKAFHPNSRLSASTKLSSNHGFNQGILDGQHMSPNKGIESNIHGTKLLK